MNKRTIQIFMTYKILLLISVLVVSSVMVGQASAIDYTKVNVNDIVDHTTKLEKGDNIFFKPIVEQGEFSIDICVYNLKKGDIKVVSSDSKGTVGDKLSNYYSSDLDGKKVTFQSWATNFDLDKSSGTSIYMKDITTNELKKISPYAFMPTMSDDGRYIVYEYNQNTQDNIPPWLVLYEVETGALTNIAPTSGGKGYMWETQVFRFEGNLVIFNSSAPMLNNYMKKGPVTYSYDIVTKEVVEYVG